MIRTPVIIVNFKVYESAIGQKAVELAKICEKVGKESGKEIVVCVNAVDLKEVCSAVSIPVFAEHMDPSELGSNTGSIPAQSLTHAGAKGTLLNHAEKQIDIFEIKESIAKAKENKLITCVCANDVDKAKEISQFEPDFIAVEPPELIGGDISVTNADPEIVSGAAKIYSGGEKNYILVGAGVKTGADVKKSIELGAKGVLLASGITKADDPESVLRDLVSGLD